MAGEIFAGEDEDLQRAIALSLQDQQFQQTIQKSLRSNEREVTYSSKLQSESWGEDATKIKQPSMRPLHPRKRGIDDCINDLINQSPNELELLFTPGADAMVFVDVPQKQDDQSDDLYEQILAHFSKPFYMRSQKLLELRSRYFTARLSPAFQNPQIQTKILDRHGIDSKPDGIKYVLDLTPKLEGNEALSAVMNMSCPRGVLLWSQSSLRWEVSQELVGGQDEFTEAPVHQTSVAGGSSSRSTPNTSHAAPAIPHEYTPVRHLTSIQRFLRAVEDQDPHLDSASKLYSTVMASKQFGIANTHPLTDYVVRWLRAEPNTRFLEAFPEVALEMASVLKCAPVCKDAFAVLVGEAALDQVLQDPAPQLDLRHTAHWRKRGELHEAWQSRIEYARNSFVDRVKREFDDLAGPEMDWMERISSIQKLKHVAAPLSECSGAYTELLSCLKEFVRGSIYLLLCSGYSPMQNPFKPDRPGGDELYPLGNIKTVWYGLRHQERIFTRCFWEILGGINLPGGQNTFGCGSNLKAFTTMDHYDLDLTESIEFMQLRQANVFREVFLKDLDEKVKKLAVSLRANANIGPWSPWLTIAKLCSRKANDSDPSDESPSKRRRSEDAHETGRVLPVRTVGDNQNLQAEVSATPNAPTGTSDYEIEPRIKEEVVDTPMSTSESASNFNLTSEKADQGRSTSIYSSDDPDEHDVSLPVGLPNVPTILNEAAIYIQVLASRMLAPPVGGQLGEHVEVNLQNVLLCLQNSETQYLPLWADGFDDGTGGVYGSDPPPAQEGLGFRAPGPRIHHADSSAASSSEFDMCSADSTHGTSTAVQDGYSDTLDHLRVYAVADDDASSALSSDISCVWADVRAAVAAGSPRQSAAVASAALDGASDYDVPTPVGDWEAPAVDERRLCAELEAREREEEIAAAETWDNIFADDEDDGFDPTGDDDGDINPDYESGEDEVSVEDESYGGFDEDGEDYEEVRMVDVSEGTTADLDRKSKGKARECLETEVNQRVGGMSASTIIRYKEDPDDELEDRP